MRQGQKSRVLILVLISLGLVAVILYSSLPERPLSMFNSPLSAIVTPLRNFGENARKKISDYFSSASENAELRAANEALKKENLDLRLRIRENEKAAEEFYKIRDAFKLKDSFSDRNFLAAHILPSPAKRNFDLLKIDLGVRDGLSSSDTAEAVLSASGGVFGRIYKSEYRGATVLPAWHEGFSISARTEADTAHNFRVRGDFKLKKKGLLKADQITVSSAIAKGDLVVSSGIGGIFPPGLPIGEVEEIFDSAEEGYREAIIKPFVDFSDCPIVFVLLHEAEEDLR